MNGYFRLICEESRTCLQVIPPSEGGEPVTVNEIAEYLNKRGISYSKEMLYTIAGKKEACAVVLNHDRHLEERESFLLNVSPDKMQAVVRFYPPSKAGSKLTKDEFLRDLNFKGVKFGIQERAIDQFFERRRFCEDILVAVGKEPRHGTDARIEYYFNTDLKARPTLKDDGSVDFFHLNNINHCHKGDILARLFPEDPGEAGMNVMGEKIKPRDVKRRFLRYGRNIEVSEDKLTMISKVDGHVTLVDDKVFVSDVLVVENVDNSTGDIEFEGSVQINGNVCANFSVTAKGNIEIAGFVEGAYLEAGGDIIIARGINGMGKGVLNARGNIVVKFMENTRTTARGYVHAESILHSTVQAGDEITVTGRRGFITGGRVCATHCITVKTLGSSMGADTIVEVGTDPTLKFRIQDLTAEIAEAGKVVKSVQPLLDATQQKLAKGIKLSPDQIQYMKSLIVLSKVKSKEVEEKTEELNRLQESLGSMVNASVIVTGVVFPGTRIGIGDVSMIVQKEAQYCRFIKSEGDVKLTAI
ncbi:MAG: FapA family protein [Lachnospiraceae bacterium]|nr:FapA family protein [Lachnospiraceae bacterium]